MSIRVVTDSSCDLPQSMIDELKISVVPLSIRFGDEEFIDRVDIDNNQFWERCRNSSQLPETAAPSVGQFEEVYRRLKSEGATGIVVVSLSSGLSATMQSAELAARQVAGDIPVEVVDSQNVSMCVGIIAMSCAEMARSGASLADVAAHGRQLVPRTRVFGALDTLENLKKGGRIGAAKAMLATALSIKPIITTNDGLVAEGGKARTRSKALQLLIDKLKDAGPIERLGVLHAQCSDVDQFVAMVRTVYSGEITVGEIGPVIGTHAGLGTIGIAFITAS
jgi:DegV family protein with EDD domain